MKLPHPKARLQNNLKVLRAIKDMTQEQLAEKINVSKKTISTIETGKMVPSTEIALLLARALNTSVEMIFKLADSELPSSE